jgi:hypothetical protein
MLDASNALPGGQRRRGQPDRSMAAENLGGATQRPSRPLAECRLSGDLLPDDERVDLMRAFIGIGGLEVHHMSEGLVVIENAVGAQNLPAHPGNIPRHGDVVALRQ